MPLKLGTLEDLPDILRMAREFHKSSPFGDLPFEDDKVTRVVTELLGPRSGGVIILEENNRALLAAAITEPIFSSKKLATEVMWWVDSDIRGTAIGRELLDAYEYWAQIQGCELSQMVCLETQERDLLDRYYKRRGYRPVEYTYVKEL
jgi:GNAT superfamily N-acetyltransferase